MRKSFKKEKNHRILWTVLIVVAIVAACAFGFFAAKNGTFSMNKPVPRNMSPVSVKMNFELDPGISYEHAATENKLFFYSSENIKIINDEGELEKDFSLPVSKPFISARGKYALIADKGGRKAYLFRGSKQITEIELTESIILANVNDSGNSVFVTKGETHQCSVSVLNSKGNEKFKWNSGGLYVLAADISDNGKDIAVSALNTDGGVLTSNVIMFSVNKEKPFANDVYKDEVFAGVHFNGNTMYAIGEGAAYIYNGYGKISGMVDYAERELLSCNTDGNALALVFSGSGLSLGAGDLETYNLKGEKLGQFHSPQEISFVDCLDGKIAVKNGRFISVLDTKCRESFQISPETDLLDLMFFGGNLKAAGISAAGAHMITLSKN